MMAVKFCLSLVSAVIWQFCEPMMAEVIFAFMRFGNMSFEKSCFFIITLGALKMNIALSSTFSPSSFWLDFVIFAFKISFVLKVAIISVFTILSLISSIFTFS